MISNKLDRFIFLEFIDDAKVALAKLFLSEDIRQFVSNYRKREHPKKSRDEGERMLDLIVAWELHRVELGGDWNLLN